MQKQRELDQLVRSVAESGDKLNGAERRSFLKNGLALRFANEYRDDLPYGWLALP